MSKKFMIYSIHHKGENYSAYRNDVVTSILAGEKPSPARKDIDKYDDSGHYNISDKNITYGEFTATYWAWKNSDADYLGIMHYRRALNFNSQYYPSGEDFCQLHGLTKKRLETVFADTDIAVGEPMPLYPNIYEQYKACHLFAEEVFKEMKEYLKIHYPEMVRTFDSHFYSSDELGYFKCQIMAKREVFDEYAEFLFGALGYLEEKFSQRITGKAEKEKRFYAFIGERLTSLFIKHIVDTNKYRVKCFPISFYDSLNKYNTCKKSLLENYYPYLREEPEGYLRHFFYHQKTSNERDRRVSLNINFVDHERREYSAIMRKGIFEEYKLNTSQLVRELDALPIIDDGQKVKIKLNNCSFSIGAGKEQAKHFRYMTSGSLNYYEAYIANWNEPDFNYHPLDKSLTDKTIFVFRLPGSSEYTVSSRLYAKDFPNGFNGPEKLFYFEAKKYIGNYQLEIYYRSDSYEEPEKRVSRQQIHCIDNQKNRIRLAISGDGFIVDGKAPVQSVLLSDWDGYVFEVYVAKWHDYQAKL